MELYHLYPKHLPRLLAEGRRAENRQTGLILWDQSRSIKWGTDTNLNPKDLPEMIRWKGIGLEQPFSSLPLILWHFPSMWVMLALGSSLSFCPVCSGQLVQQERSRVPSLWDSWRSQCQDGEWYIELSFSQTSTGVFCAPYPVCLVLRPFSKLTGCQGITQWRKSEEGGIS